MQEIDTFIKEAKEKGLDDATIRKALETNGWDTAQIDLALSGIVVPKPQDGTNSAPNTPVTTPHTTHPSLSPLMAALHHVILWFFTASSAVAIGGTVASLYGWQVSTNALASMIAVTLITFIPYAVLFFTFLVKTRKTPSLIPGKVWSIITICLHSVGVMIAAIVAVINIVTGGEQVYLVGAALILLLDLIIVTTYSLAAFGFGKLAGLRKVIISLHLILLVAMFGILFSLSLLKLGPAQHDETLRKDMSEVVYKIAQKTKQQNKLPSSITDINSNPSITYKTTGDKTYQLCSDFQTSNMSLAHSREYYSNATTDAYSDESQFYTSASGNQCFDFTSDYLEQKEAGGTPSIY